MAARLKRWRLNNFSAGIDRTDGRVTDQQNRVHTSVNYRTVNTKRVRRRPPNRKPGAISNCQGLIAHRGALYTIAKRGDTPVLPTISQDGPINVVYFDVPEGCGSGWTLLKIESFVGSIEALISHDFNGVTMTSRVFKHVFDAKPDVPTYVEDPAVPTSWAPALAQHFTGKGAVGAFSDYRPRLTIANNRDWISRPDGDLAFSGSSKPRVYNELTVDDLMENGQSWNFFIPDGAGPLYEFQTSAPFDQRYVYTGVLEYLDSEGRWITMPQVASGTPGADKFWTTITSSPAWATSARAKVQLYWTGDAETQIRYRMVVFGTNSIAITDPSPALGFDEWGTFTCGSGGSWSGNGAGDIDDFNDPAGTGQQLATSAHMIEYFQEAVIGTPLTKRIYYGHGNADVTVVGYPAFAQKKHGTYIGDVLPTGSVGKAIRIQKYTDATVTLNQTTSIPTYTGSDTLIDFAFTIPNGSHLLIQNFSGNFERYIAGSSGTSGVLLLDNAGASGDFTTALGNAREVWVIATGPEIEFRYPAETNVAGADFALEQETIYRLELAGDQDAGVLPTSAQPSAGGSLVTALSSLKDRLLVSYKSGSQLWYIPPTPSEHRIVDSGPIGTGEQVLPCPQVVLGIVIMAMSQGMRGQGLTGLELQALRDRNLGEGIADLGYPQQSDAAYWPQVGAYVSAVTIDDDVMFLALDLEPKEKIQAWRVWTVADLPEVEENSMSVLDRRLYFRAGGDVYFFDEADTVYRDDTDPEAGDGDAFESFMKWHFNDLKEPFRTKHVAKVEMAHIGRAYVELFQDVRHPDQGNGEFLMIDTLNNRWVPAVARGQAIALSVRSVDDTGHEIEEIGLHFRVLGRG